ncbi:choice-of-anchor W domain-containing protein [Halolamina rubra]|uniref:choice-of-anchor W domain-containing protein n=1 Tax=Halolamina rubra TaxID=1380430 RepID=UPI0006795A15|nr:choice-of-anchor W domain-containing protein [Halolamina rubra]
MSDDNKFDLTRRKALAGLGGIGAGAALGGTGTMAFLSDSEEASGVMTAGTLDLIVEYYSHWHQGSGGDYVSGSINGEAVTGNLSDVKPGDSGLIALCPRVETNPAYLWLCGELTANNENGITDPESEVDSTGGDGNGELAQNVEVTVQYCDIADDIGDSFDEDDVESSTDVWSGTLAELFDDIQYGVPLDGDEDTPDDDDNGGFFEPGDQDCYPGTGDEGEGPCLCLDWKVPDEVGNVIQSDSLSFDLQLYAQQCRHNDGTDNPCAGITTETGDDFAKQSENFNDDGTISGGARARYGNNGSSGAWELAVGDEPGVDGEFSQANYTWTSGDPVDWTVSYDEASDELSFTFDGNTITDTLDDPQPDGRMAIQGKADDATVDASIDSLSIGGSSVTLDGPNAVTATNDGDGRQVRYLLVDTALDGSTDFELSGEATVTVQGDYGGSEEGVAFDVVFE